MTIAHARPTPSTRRCRRRGSAVLLPLAALAAAWLLAAGSSQAQSYPVYTITALPMSSVTAFNDSGLVLGRAFLPCAGLCTLSDAAVLYDTRSGTVTALGGSFGAGAQFDAIDARGRLAGSATTLDGNGLPVRQVVLRQTDGTLTPLVAPTLSTTQTSGLRARGLNAAGQIALVHSDGLDVLGPLCGNHQGWIGTGATAGAWVPLGAPGTVLQLAGINAAGVAVGASAAAAVCSADAFRATAARPTGALVDLHGTMPGRFSRALGINDLGYAVGEHDTGLRTLPDAAHPQGVPIVHAAVWNTAAAAWFDLGPPGMLSRLRAVNNRGEVVGSTNGSASSGAPYAVTAPRAVVGNLATAWPLADLNGLLANNTDGWVLQDAVAINGAGQIIARGVSAEGSGHALLTPVGAPVDPYATVPSAPASLALSQVTSTSALLTWTNTARNATRLVVERCKGSGCTGFAAVATLPGDTARFGATGLARRTTYRWRVRAGNAAGLSAAGNVAAATTLR